MKISLVALALSTTALLMACSAAGDGQDEADSDDVTEDEAIQAKIAPIEAKLGDRPHQQPSNCDVHTFLSIKNVGGAKATLNEAVSGIPGQPQCKLAVQPNFRTYKLKLARVECGSGIYTGSIKKAGKTYAIEITDHRTRVCEDIVPAAVIVKETVPGFPGAITTTKYTRDEAAPETVEVTGKLMRTMGIGGENTGYTLMATAGSSELILDAGERNQFAEGKTARVRGTKKLLSGVETQNRPAIDVTEMLVCPNPGYVNCMPGPNVRLSNLCGETSWVTANCPGVGFAY